MSTLETAQSVSELTVEQAAEILGILESEVLVLLDAGKIEFHSLENQRKVVAQSLYQYRHEMKCLQKEGLDELVQQAQELGLYE